METELTRILTENGIDQAHAETMAVYADFMVSENKKYNLTRITDNKEMAEKHFLDSLSVIEMTGISFGPKVLDIGTGPGFPGVPYAIVNEESTVTVLDSASKKIAFIREACQLAGINNVIPVSGRAEELAADEEYREKFDLVVSRAVAPLNILLELSAGFVKPEGYFIAYKGASVEEELDAAGESYKKLGFEAPDVKASDDGNTQHCLVVFRKITGTPKGYPRPYAKIKKAPLK